MDARGPLHPALRITFVLHQPATHRRVMPLDQSTIVTSSAGRDCHRRVLRRGERDRLLAMVLRRFLQARSVSFNFNYTGPRSDSFHYTAAPAGLLTCCSVLWATPVHLRIVGPVHLWTSLTLQTFKPIIGFYKRQRLAFWSLLYTCLKFE